MYCTSVHAVNEVWRGKEGSIDTFDLLNYSVLYNIWKTGRKLERLLINIKNVGLFYTLPYPL